MMFFIIIYRSQNFVSQSSHAAWDTKIEAKSYKKEKRKRHWDATEFLGKLLLATPPHPLSTRTKPDFFLVLKIQHSSAIFLKSFFHKLDRTNVF